MTANLHLLQSFSLHTHFLKHTKKTEQLILKLKDDLQTIKHFIDEKFPADLLFSALNSLQYFLQWKIKYHSERKLPGIIELDN